MSSHGAAVGQADQPNDNPWSPLRLLVVDDDATQRDLIARAAGTMLHVDLDRVSPLAVPVLVLIGRESVAQGTADDALLIEAEALAAEAMRPD